jgi:hypothetical protein
MSASPFVYFQIAMLCINTKTFVIFFDMEAIGVIGNGSLDSFPIQPLPYVIISLVAPFDGELMISKAHLLPFDGAIRMGSPQDSTPWVPCMTLI